MLANTAESEGTNLQSSCDGDDMDSTGFNVEYTDGDVLIGEQRNPVLVQTL